MSDVYQEGVAFLYQAKQDIEERDAIKKKLEDDKNKEKKLKKNVASEEKSITDEINTTVKKRKNEITSSYDRQIDENREKMKQVHSKRNAKKEKRMGARFANETADIKEENRQLLTEMKTLFKKEQVQGFCNSTAYYALFMPKGIKEILIFLLFFAVFIGGLPTGIYFLLKNTIYAESGVPTIVAVVIYAAIIILVFVAYFSIYNATKFRHRDAILQGRKFRDQIRANNKKIRAVKNAISKDKDESQYNLGAYDQKISAIEDSTNQISREKQDALTEFENVTKIQISDEINSRRRGVVMEMKAQLKELDDGIAKEQEVLSEKSLLITNQYEAYLGKDYCKSSIIDKLIALMETGSAATVGEAVSVMRGGKKQIEPEENL